MIKKIPIWIISLVYRVALFGVNLYFDIRRIIRDIKEWWERFRAGEPQYIFSFTLPNHLHIHADADKYWAFGATRLTGNKQIRWLIMLGFVVIETIKVLDHDIEYTSKRYLWRA